MRTLKLCSRKAFALVSMSKLSIVLGDKNVNAENGSGLILCFFVCNTIDTMLNLTQALMLTLLIENGKCEQTLRPFHTVCQYLKRVKQVMILFSFLSQSVDIMLDLTVASMVKAGAK